MYYLIDHAGIIWGQSFGMPAQMGYVKYFWKLSFFQV
jgi:hypothetical protein